MNIVIYNAASYQCNSHRRPALTLFFPTSCGILLNLPNCWILSVKASRKLSRAFGYQYNRNLPQYVQREGTGKIREKLDNVKAFDI